MPSRSFEVKTKKEKITKCIKAIYTIENCLKTNIEIFQIMYSVSLFYCDGWRVKRQHISGCLNLPSSRHNSELYHDTDLSLMPLSLRTFACIKLNTSK